MLKCGVFLSELRDQFGNLLFGDLNAEWILLAIEDQARSHEMKIMQMRILRNDGDRRSCCAQRLENRVLDRGIQFGVKISETRIKVMREVQQVISAI